MVILFNAFCLFCLVNINFKGTVGSFMIPPLCIFFKIFCHVVNYNVRIYRRFIKFNNN